jgi:hypothetical protein
MNYDPFSYVSFGGGRQSTALALLLIHRPEKFIDLGLTIPQNIIFADTGAEPNTVYRHIDLVSRLLIDAGFSFNIVFKKNKEGDFIPIDHLHGRGITTIPYFTHGSDSKIGMLRRQCTNEYKIEPITQFIRTNLGYFPKQRVTHDINLWLGISLDESSRMSTNKLKWITNQYPLIQLKLTAADCTALASYYLGYLPPKSSCYMCPFTNQERWQTMKQLDPDTFAKACEFDRNIRHLSTFGKISNPCYIHPSGLPLDRAVLDQPFLPGFHTSAVRGFSQECQGHCGV